MNVSRNLEIVRVEVSIMHIFEIPFQNISILQFVISHAKLGNLMYKLIKKTHLKKYLMPCEF